eukprot:TRINITY_DN3869_c0_g2_i1.p1 TRINITY_DN3869_c0_g2~~TRINITY_DN3869_c0_g2_i1.p1  ORF type:complete len:2354 (+),score=804.62 TRINITY_DN3869_c0_g2_i1:85-7062(+)
MEEEGGSGAEGGCGRCVEDRLATPAPPSPPATAAAAPSRKRRRGVPTATAHSALLKSMQKRRRVERDHTTKIVSLPTPQGDPRCPQCGRSSKELCVASAVDFRDHVFDCRVSHGANPLCPVVALLPQPPPAPRAAAACTLPRIPLLAADGDARLASLASPRAPVTTLHGCRTPSLRAAPASRQSQESGSAHVPTPPESLPYAALRPLPSLPPIASQISATGGGRSSSAAALSRVRASEANGTALRRMAAACHDPERKALLHHLSRMAFDKSAETLDFHGYEPLHSDALPLVGQVLTDHPKLSSVELLAPEATSPRAEELRKATYSTIAHAVQENPALKTVTWEGVKPSKRQAARLNTLLDQSKRYRDARDREREQADRSSRYTQWLECRTAERREVEESEADGRRRVLAAVAAGRRADKTVWAAGLDSIARKEHRLYVRECKERQRQEVAGAENAGRTAVRVRQLGDSLWLVLRQSDLWLGMLSEGQVSVRAVLKADEEQSRRVSRRREWQRLDQQRLARAGVEGEESQSRDQHSADHTAGLAEVQRLWDDDIKYARWRDQQRGARAELGELEGTVRRNVCRDEVDARGRVREHIQNVLARQAEEDAQARENVQVAEMKTRKQCVADFMRYLDVLAEEVELTRQWLEQKLKQERVEAERVGLARELPKLSISDGVAPHMHPACFYLHPADGLLEPPTWINTTSTCSVSVAAEWEEGYTDTMERLRAQCRETSEAKQKAVRTAARGRKFFIHLLALDPRTRQARVKQLDAAEVGADDDGPPATSPTTEERLTAAFAAPTPPRARRKSFKQGVARALNGLRMMATPMARPASPMTPTLSAQTSADLLAEKRKIRGGWVEMRCVPSDDDPEWLAGHDLLSCVTDYEVLVDGVHYPGSNPYSDGDPPVIAFGIPDDWVMPATLEGASPKLERTDSESFPKIPGRLGLPPASAATPPFVEAGSVEEGAAEAAESSAPADGCSRPGTAERPTTAEDGAAQTLDTPMPAADVLRTAPAGGVVRVLLPTDASGSIPVEAVAVVMRSFRYQCTANGLVHPFVRTVECEVCLLFTDGAPTATPFTPSSTVSSTRVSMRHRIVLSLPFVTLRPSVSPEVEFVEGMGPEELQLLPEAVALHDPPTISRTDSGDVIASPGGRFTVATGVTNFHDSYVFIEATQGLTEDDFFVFRATTRTWLDSGRIFTKDREGIATRVGTVVRGLLHSSLDVDPCGPAPPATPYVVLHFCCEDRPLLLSSEHLLYLLRGIRFGNLSQAPVEGPRQVLVRVADKRRHVCSAPITVQVTGRDDPTEVRIPLQRFTLRVSSVVERLRQYMHPTVLPLCAGTTVADVDTDRFAGGSLRVVISGPPKGEGIALCCVPSLLWGPVKTASWNLRETRLGSELSDNLDTVSLMAPGRMVGEAKQEGGELWEEVEEQKRVLEESSAALMSPAAAEPEPAVTSPKISSPSVRKGSPAAASSEPQLTQADSLASMLSTPRLPRRLSSRQRKSVRGSVQFTRETADAATVDTAVKDVLVKRALRDHLTFDDELSVTDGAVVFQGRTIGRVESGVVLTSTTDTCEGCQEVVVQFSEDGMMSVEAIQALLRRMVIGLYGAKLPAVTRTVEFILSMGPTVNGFPETDKCEIPEIEELTTVPIPSLQLRSAPPLFSVPEKYLHVDYREGSGAQRLAPFEVVSEKGGALDNFSNGFVLVEMVSGGEEEDKVGLREDDTIQLRVQQATQKPKMLGLMKRARRSIMDTARGSTSTQPESERGQAGEEADEAGGSSGGTPPASPLSPMSPVMTDALAVLKGRPKPGPLTQVGRVTGLFAGAVNAIRQDAGFMRQPTAPIPADPIRDAVEAATASGEPVIQAIRKYMRETIKQDDSARHIKVRDIMHAGWQQPIATLHEGGFGMLAVVFKGDQRNPVLRKHVLTILKNLSYTNFSCDPQIVTKVFRITMCEQPPAYSQAIVKIQLHTVDDVTEILLESQRLRYMHQPDAQPFCLCPYGKAKLFDPDTDFFDGGHVIVQDTAKGSKGERLGFLTPDEQAALLPEWSAKSAGPFCTGEVFKLRFSPDGRKVYRTAKGKGGVDVHVATVDLDKDKRTLRIDFAKPADSRVVPINLASYLLNCVTYTNDSQDMRAKVSTKILQIRIADGENPTEGKTKLQVAVFPPAVVFSPWAFTMKLQPSSGELDEGVLVFEGGKSKLMVMVPDEQSKPAPLTQGYCLVSLSNPAPDDSLSLRPDSQKEPLVVKAKESGSVQHTVLLKEVPLARVDITQHSIRVDFGSMGRMHGKHLQQMLRLVTFKRKAPGPAVVTVSVAVTTADKGDVAKCATEIAVPK